VVIVILAAILLPALARARESARRASCQSNLKQPGLTFKMYAGECRGAYPPMFPGYYSTGPPVRAAAPTPGQVPPGNRPHHHGHAQTHGLHRRTSPPGSEDGVHRTLTSLLREMEFAAVPFLALKSLGADALEEHRQF